MHALVEAYRHLNIINATVAKVLSEPVQTTPEPSTGRGDHGGKRASIVE